MSTSGELLKKCLLAGYRNLELNKEHINELNVFPVPDGDTGTNMSLTMKSAVRTISELHDVTFSSVAKAASNGSLMGARGNSGVILSQILRGFYKGFKDHDEISPIALRDGFLEAYKTAYKAVMKPTEGTILTVIREMGEFAEENFLMYEKSSEFAKQIIAEGSASLLRTPELLPVLKEAGVVDSGAKGLMVILEGCLNYENENYQSEEFEIIKSPMDTNAHPEMNSDEIEFGYCTEFMIQSEFGDALKFREEITPLGDCIIVVKGEDVIKTHIHTNHPGEVLEKALKLGQLKDLKIENMRFQHEHLLSSDHDVARAGKKEKEREHKKYGFVAISTGDGLSELFKTLNVDEIILGGQTMNPSTEDIHNAVRKIDADHIFILPNNKNIILAANQTKELSDQDVHVIESKSIPQGIAALIAFEMNQTVEENVNFMTAALADVKTGQVTYSIRDTKIGDIDVKKNDIIGLDEREIRAVGKDINTVSYDLITQLLDEDSSLITIYYGEGVDLNAAEKLQEMIENNYEDLDIEIIKGDQPIYYYLVSIEK